ncbi:MAG: cell division protein FtsA [Nitrospira sp.]|nr:cell division protein FtsA [Nitrospira sp.]
MGRKDNIVVGLDIGTTKICAVVSEMGEGTGTVDIIGIGTSPSRGLKKGIVINIESTVESIKRAVEEAELMSGVEINSVYTGIAGSHIRGFNSRGVIAVKDHEVRKADIRRVIEAAKAVAIPMDREVLHVLPQAFVVDDQEGIKDPLGMSGVRLEAEVHIITGAVTSAQNIVKCVNRAGLEVLDMILQPLASGEAVLTSEEKELGVAVVDIGGGTTDLAIFVEGSIWHSAVLAIGGNHLTNDIAIGLRTPAQEAERIKIRYGCAKSSMVRDEETVEVPSVGGRPPRKLSRTLLAEIIEPRAEEIFSLVAREIRRAGYEEKIAAGVVLTGGTAMLEGLVDVAEHILDLPVRKGIPMSVGGLVDVVSSPMYATGVGLILYALRDTEHHEPVYHTNGRFVSKVFDRMTGWLKELF